jgi:hypothetical protein
MIRHRPFGSGHAYADSDDQRVPARPADGQQVELRVAAARSVTSIRCEWQADESTTWLDLSPVKVSSEHGSGDGTAEGHLAQAAAGRSGASVGWQAISPTVQAGTDVRYRFHATALDNAQRRSRWYELEAACWSSSGGALSVEGKSRIVDGSATWFLDSAGAHRVRFAIAVDPSEHVVGFGERFDRLDQRGHRIDTVVFEQYKGQAAAGRTYFPMPFAHVLGGTGWAVHVDTSARTWFDVGATEPDRIWVEADLPGDGPGELTVRFYDGTPADNLRNWLDLVGRPTEMPDWVFGLWASGNEWNTQARVLDEVDRHHREDIPVSVVVVEAWSDEATFVAFRDAHYDVHTDGSPHRLADFTFPPDGAWPDPKSMADALHDQGIRLILWQIPLAKMRPHPTGQAQADAAVMIERGYGVHEADGRPYRNRGWWFPLALMPDFTNPDARRWWLDKRRYLVEEVGIDGFKNRRRRTRLGPRPALPRRIHRNHRQQQVPRALRGGLRGAAGIRRQATRHLQPRRIHRITSPRHILGRR